MVDSTIANKVLCSLSERPERSSCCPQLLHCPLGQGESRSGGGERERGEGGKGGRGKRRGREEGDRRRKRGGRRREVKVGEGEKGGG